MTRSEIIVEMQRLVRDSENLLFRVRRTHEVHGMRKLDEALSAHVAAWVALRTQVHLIEPGDMS